jgi:hypothetical protein
MVNDSSKLVIVAHPDDETLGFSSVCAQADVVCVTDGGWKGRAEERAREFRRATELLGAKRAWQFNFPDVYPWRIPVCALATRLRELGGYDRVYTHSPFDAHPHHRDIALAAAHVFREIYVQSKGGYAPDAEVLDQASFERKLNIINKVYAREIRSPDGCYELSQSEISGVEAFVRVTSAEVIRALALTRPEVLTDPPDIWSFDASPYEIERYERTCDLLMRGTADDPPQTILELGACEGVMTCRLHALFPAAALTAVEPNPAFVKRLKERFIKDPSVRIVEASAVSVSKDADLVVASEMLYYLPEHIAEVIANVRARYFLTAYYADFDLRICQCMSGYGWREVAHAELLPRFEPVDGRSSLLLARRAGSNIRLWAMP